MGAVRRRDHEVWFNSTSRQKQSTRHAKHGQNQQLSLTSAQRFPLLRVLFHETSHWQHLQPSTTVVTTVVVVVTIHITGLHHPHLQINRTDIHPL